MVYRCVAVRLSMRIRINEILGMDDFLIYAKLLDGRGGARDISAAELAEWQPEHGGIVVAF